MTETITLGLVVWIATTILVESELLRPLREAADRWAGPGPVEEKTVWVGPELLQPTGLSSIGPLIPGHWQLPTSAAHPVRYKLAYLIHCHLCAGTWIGLVTAAVTPYRPLASLPPLGAWLLAGLLYKAVAHLILAVNNTLRRYS